MHEGIKFLRRFSGRHETTPYLLHLPDPPNMNASLCHEARIAVQV